MFDAPEQPRREAPTTAYKTEQCVRLIIPYHFFSYTIVHLKSGLKVSLKTHVFSF